MGVPSSALRGGVPLVDALGPTHVSHAPVIESAGALVWRVRDDELQVRLVHRPRYDDWSWPKGKLDPGETFQAAAAREVAEETGKPVVLGVPLPGLQYLTPEGRVKRVHYWAARRASGRSDAGALAARAPSRRCRPRRSTAPRGSPRTTPRGASPGRPTGRRSRRSCASVTRAGSRRTSSSSRATARPWRGRRGTATSRTARSRPRATPRGGARAGARGLRRRDDRHEPLGPLRPDDRALRDRLRPRHGQHRPPHRGAARAVPARVARTVRELLEAERSSVLCTHRPVLPTVLDVLGQHSRRPVANALPAHDPFLEPGEMIVAHVARTPKGPRVVAAEKVAPPLH